VSAFITIGPPSLAGFTAWIVYAMGISTSVLPPDSPIISIAYQVAWDTVNPAIACVAPNEYTLAVYNLAGNNLVNFAPDVPNAPPYKTLPDGSTLPYFAYLRYDMKLNAFTPGVVASTSDEGTSVSLLNPEFMKTLGMSDTQLVKTPWGRQYMAFAQKYGTLWGLS
jgi:hypothetical protein